MTGSDDTKAALARAMKAIASLDKFEEIATGLPDKLDAPTCLRMAEVMREMADVLEAIAIDSEMLAALEKARG
jgi:hypothetical protein